MSECVMQQIVACSVLFKLCSVTTSNSTHKALKEILEGIQSISTALHQILRL